MLTRRTGIRCYCWSFCGKFSLCKLHENQIFFGRKTSEYSNANVIIRQQRRFLVITKPIDNNARPKTEKSN